MMPHAEQDIRVMDFAYGAWIAEGIEERMIVFPSRSIRNGTIHFRDHL